MEQLEKIKQCEDFILEYFKDLNISLPTKTFNEFLEDYEKDYDYNNRNKSLEFYDEIELSLHDGIFTYQNFKNDPTLCQYLEFYGFSDPINVIKLLYRIKN